ncbi:TlpA family protein disulfide reductase [Virgibacillus oceani]
MRNTKLLVFLPTFIVMTLFAAVAFVPTAAQPKNDHILLELDDTLQEVVEGTDVGNMAPDFGLETLDGEEVHLSDYQGERILLNFWATWCGPCREEMPDIQRLFEDKNVTVLGVNLTYSEGSIETVTDFVSQYKLEFPVLLDENSSVSQLYRIQPIPTTYMIDSNGKIQYKAFGAMDYEWMVQELEKIK